MLNIAHKDWDYDTRNLDNSIAPLQKIIENKLQLYEKRHLPNAVKALRALKERLIENEARYKAVKGLWDKATKLTMQEASGKAGREFIKIATASDELKNALGANTNEVRLSAWTIYSHLYHDNITAFDYSIIQYAIKKPYKIEPSKNKNEHILLFSKYGIHYKAVFKLTSKNEIYLQSLVSSPKELR